MKSSLDAETSAARHRSPAAPYSPPGLRRRLAALRAGLNAAMRALRVPESKH